MHGDTLSQRNSIRAAVLVIFNEHSTSWQPFLYEQYGQAYALEIAESARQQLDVVILAIPDIGGDANPMTRHLLRSTTSLALYLAMRKRRVPAAETGALLYRAVEASVARLPWRTFELTEAFILREQELARLSQARRYPGDWVWEYIPGDGRTFDYGYNFYECGTRKLYHRFDADEFLPYYCALDFATQHTLGWQFSRTMTLASGGAYCDFRWLHTIEEEPPSPSSRS
ncbi:MAG: L-2-amino-thiazoline-4-carboxylic acid hydrolase [Anaerolineae bacterium]